MPNFRLPHIDFHYDLREVSCDQRVPQTSTVQGFCPVLDGVDGRFNGQIRPLPGFDSIHCLGNLISGNYDVYDVTYLEGVSVNVSTTKVWSGFVARVQITSGVYSSATVKIVFEYYDGTDWQSVDIESTDDTGIDSGLRDDPMQAKAIGRLLYIFRDSRDPILLYFDEETGGTRAGNLQPVIVTNTGPGPKPPAPNCIFATDPTSDITVNSLNGQTDMDVPDSQPLDQGLYSVAYQFYDTISGRYSQLSEVFTLTDTDLSPANTTEGNRIGRFPGETNHILFELDLQDAGIYDSAGDFSGVFDRIRIFRSVKAQSVGTIRSSAIMHLEGEYPIDNFTGSDNIYIEGGLNSGERLFRKFFTLPDLALNLQETYDNSTAILENMPQTSAAGVLGGTLFVSNKVQGSNDPNNIAEIRWSSPISTSPELFPVFQKYSVGDPNRAPIAFARAGDFLIGASKSNIYFILKSGASVEIRPALEGYGIVNFNSMVSAGDSAYLLSPEGILEVNSQAQLSPVQVFDNTLKGQDLTGYTATYDPTTGSVWFFDKNSNSAKVLWINTAKATTYSAFPARAAGQGYDPVDDDGRLRAVFAYANGNILKIRPNFSDQSSMVEMPNLPNGFALLSEIFDQDDMVAPGQFIFAAPGVTASGARSMIGLTIAQIDGPSKGAIGYVEDATVLAGNITLTVQPIDGVPNAAELDGVWTWNCTRFRVRGWPIPTLSEGQDPNTPTRWPDPYTQRTINNIGVVFDNIYGEDNNNIFPADLKYLLITYFARVYQNQELAPQVTAFLTDHDGNRLQIAEGAPTYYTSVDCNGTLLLPEINMFVNRYHFQLYGFRVLADVSPEA